MERPDKYILDESGNPVVEPDLMKWGHWMGTGNRHIALDRLAEGVKISTLFLGVDYNFGEGPPILFETMIFGGEHDQYQERYETREQALEGHKRAVQLAISNPVNQQEMP